MGLTPETPDHLSRQGLYVLDATANPKLGYSSLHLGFVDQTIAKQQDAFEFTLSPRGRSEIFKITDEQVVVTDTLKQGKALLIRILSNQEGQGRVETITLDEIGQSVTHPFQSIFCWVSIDAEKPTVLFGTNSPTFADGQEAEYKFDDPHVPPQLKEAIEKFFQP